MQALIIATHKNYFALILNLTDVFKNMTTVLCLWNHVNNLFPLDMIYILHWKNCAIAMLNLARELRETKPFLDGT